MLDNGAVPANVEKSMTALAPSRNKAESKAVPPCMVFGSSNELRPVHKTWYRVLKDDFKGERYLKRPIQGAGSLR